jgi:hypothetical protein
VAAACDADLGNELPMREAEQRHRPHLFKLRLTNRVKRAMDEQDWQEAGAGWQGKDGQLRLQGWTSIAAW